MALWSALIQPIAGLFTKALDVVDKMVPDKDLATKLKAELQTRFAEISHDELITLLESRTKIILAEAQGESWLQRNWRPLLMSSFGVIIVNNYILNPWISNLFNIDVVMEIPPDMWNLLKLGLTGYVVGRSAEKISAGGGLKGALKNVMNGS